MKKFLCLFVLVCTVFSGFSQATTEEDAIKSLINKAYIEGLQNGGDLSPTRETFWPGFDLLVFKTSVIEKLPIYNWIKITEERRAKEKTPPNTPKVTCNYLFVDITGSAAVVKLELFRGTEKLFTDYLSLYKLDTGWKIVGKIYHRHPLPVPNN
jgi:hypothetical protein